LPPATDLPDGQISLRAVKIYLMARRIFFPSATQLGFTRVGHLTLSKSDKSDFDVGREAAFAPVSAPPPRDTEKFYA